MERKYYLDNIRSFTVIAVLLYHAIYMFNGVGVAGGIGGEGVLILDSFITLLYPWFMLLLFFTAGITARYSLKKRGVKAFIKERAVKLLVPSTLGLFVIHWITGYFNIKIGGGLEYIPDFLVYPVSAMSGIGPLWFAQTLFLFSLVLALVNKIDAEDKLYNLCKRSNAAVIFALVLIVWGSAQILNMPVLTMYRFGIYFAAFLIGYFILSHEEVVKRAVKRRYLWLALTVIFGAWYAVKYVGHDFTSDAVLKNAVTNAYAYFACLSAISFGKKYLDRTNGALLYLSKNSYGYYVLHYIPLIVTAYLLHTYTPLGALLKIIIVLLAEIILTFALNEGIKRIPIIRLLVLGIKNK